MEKIEVLGDGEHVVRHPQKGAQLPDERARALLLPQIVFQGLAPDAPVLRPSGTAAAPPRHQPKIVLSFTPSSPATFPAPSTRFPVLFPEWSSTSNLPDPGLRAYRVLRHT